MQRRHVTAGWLSVGMCFVAGCSLLVDTQGLAGGDAVDAASGDDQGGGDARVGDASVSLEADRADGAPRRSFCASLAPATSTFRFCADFDDPLAGGDAAAGWTAVKVALGGALLLDTTTARSLPGALNARAPDRSDTFASVITNGPAPRKTIHAEVDFQLVDPTVDGQAVSLMAVEQAGATYKRIDLYVNRGSAYFQSTGSGAAQFSLDGLTPPPGTWHHASFDIDIPNDTVTARYDGVALWSSQRNDFAFTATDPTAFSVGLTYVFKGGAAHSIVDNALFEVE